MRGGTINGYLLINSCTKLAPRNMSIIFTLIFSRVSTHRKELRAAARINLATGTMAECWTEFSSVDSLEFSIIYVWFRKCYQISLNHSIRFVKMSGSAKFKQFYTEPLNIQTSDTNISKIMFC